MNATTVARKLTLALAAAAAPLPLALVLWVAQPRARSSRRASSRWAGRSREMERATQQNAALVGQVVAATESLSTQAARLSALVEGAGSAGGRVLGWGDARGRRALT